MTKGRARRGGPLRGSMQESPEVLVVGAGMAGLTAARQVARAGHSVLVVARGLGATAESAGVVDVAGYLPGSPDPLDSASNGLEAYCRLPGHPYALLSLGGGQDPRERARYVRRLVGEALRDFQRVMKQEGYAFHGSMRRNMLLITTLGTVKPTCLCPQSMASGNLLSLDKAQLLMVGFKGYSDFDPSFCAHALESWTRRTEIVELGGIRSAMVALPGLEHDVLAIELARCLDRPDGLSQLVKQLRPLLRRYSPTHLAFPPVLGLEQANQSVERLEEELGLPVFELVSPPPSMPGQRLQRFLERAAIRQGVQIHLGIEISGGQIKDGSVRMVTLTSSSTSTSIFAKTPGGSLTKHLENAIRPQALVLATGGLLAGGLTEERGLVREAIFDLPLARRGGRLAQERRVERLWLPPVLPLEGHPLLCLGVAADGEFNPVDGEGRKVARNLFVAGSLLAGYDYTVEKNGLGVALATGYAAGRLAAAYLEAEESGG